MVTIDLTFCFTDLFREGLRTDPHSSETRCILFSYKSYWFSCLLLHVAICVVLDVKCENKIENIIMKLEIFPLLKCAMWSSRHVLKLCCFVMSFNSAPLKKFGFHANYFTLKGS